MMMFVASGGLMTLGAIVIWCAFLLHADIEPPISLVYLMPSAFSRMIFLLLVTFISKPEVFEDRENDADESPPSRAERWNQVAAVGGLVSLLMSIALACSLATNLPENAETIYSYVSLARIAAARNVSAPDYTYDIVRERVHIFAGIATIVDTTLCLCATFTCFHGRVLVKRTLPHS